MALQLGDDAPDFTAETTEGPISFHQYLGTGWGVLFSHPKDFTPVCTTELGYMAKIQPEFSRRGVKVIGLSVDATTDHDKKVANLYGMIHPNASDTFTVRSVFVIGPDKKLKLTLTYPASTGRNFDEILRVIDSLQLTAKHKVATPSDWKQGEDVIIVPSVSDSDAKTMFPSGWKTVRPYLRVVPQPK